MNLFTWSFLLAVLLSLVLRLYLSQRQIRHVRQHAAEVPAAFRDRITLQQHQLAADYCVARQRPGQWQAVADSALLLALTLGGGLQWLWQQLAARGLAGLWQGVALIGVLALLSSVLSLPFGLYRTFVIEKRFGFNRTSWPLYFTDMAKGGALAVIVGAPLVSLILWLLHAAGDWAWLWVWCSWTLFSLAMLWAYPTLIAPRFNRFTPLADPALRQRIDDLLARTGFHSDGVFVMDGSRRSSHGNAYFTGFGKTKRIVFFDTLLTQLDEGEMEAVLAHELGHFKHGHVRQRIATTFLLSFLSLSLLGWLLTLPAFYSGLGVDEMAPALGLVLFMLAAPAYTFPLTPLFSQLSRRHEYQADDFAARHSSASELISALVKLYRDNASTLTPDPLHSRFYDSHPPASLRIAHLERQAQ